MGQELATTTETRSASSKLTLEQEVHLLADEKARIFIFDMEVNQRLLNPFQSQRLRPFLEHAFLDFLNEVKKLRA